MNERSITVSHNGVEYSGVVATIKSTHFGSEDHGIATAYLHCEWGGGGVGVGGYGLDTPVTDGDGKFLRREGSGYGMDHLLALMHTVGVSRWEDLPGKHVIVLFNAGRNTWVGGVSKGIAHPTDEKRVLILAEHADEWRARHPEMAEMK